ncbi:UNVERIFIED_ORG: hypothetical protein FHR35_009139 [Microbispora rosea subsp. rosea]
MFNLMVAGCLATMWLVALIRLPGIRESSRHLYIFIALVSGCVVVSVEQPAVTAWMIEHVHRSAPFAIDMAGSIAAMTGCLCWCLTQHGSDPPRWRRDVQRIWARATVVVALLLIVALAFQLEARSSYAAMGAGHASIPQLLCLAGYEGYLVYALGSQLLRFRALAQVTTSQLVKTSLYILCFSSVGSAARSIYTMLYLVPQVLDLPQPGIPWSASFSSTVNVPFHAIGFIALTIPALSVPLEYLQTRRYLRAITPLWKELRGAYPEIVRMSERLPVRIRLVAQVTELFDALSLMFASPGVTSALLDARQAARQAGVPESRVEVVAHAASIAYALQHRAHTGEARPASWSYQDPREDLPSAIAWLADVATEFCSNAFVSRFAATTAPPALTD